MSQQQQQSPHGQFPAQALAHHHVQGMASALESSLGSSDAMAQLASQVQASMGQHIAGSSAACASLSMNPNGVMPQLVPLRAQIQNNQVVANMGAMPVMWNPANPPLGAGYQMPTLNSWAPQQQQQQGMLPQNHASVTQQPTTFHTPSMPSQKEQSANYSTAVPTEMPSMHMSSLVQPDLEILERPRGKSSKSKDRPSEFHTGDKAKHNRERNREHARSTRLRKKAYVQKLREMADGLREVQTEEIRHRRLAVEKMSDIQKTQRTVVQTVLKYHTCFESDPQKWANLLEDSFWFKQPVTPFRSFRRSEVERDCRIVRGVEAMICDSASMSMMVERVGSRNARWQRIKRKEFLERLEAEGIPNPVDHRQINVNLRAESSLSSSSSTDSSCSSSGSRSNKRVHQNLMPDITTHHVQSHAKRLSSFFEESSTGRNGGIAGSNDDSEESLSQTDSVSSSSEAEMGPRAKRHKGSNSSASDLPPNIARSGGIVHAIRPSNIARSGGIVHAVRPKPHTEIRPTIPASHHSCASSSPAPLILDTADLLSNNNVDELGAYYAVNEDDMIVIDGVLMCPLVFRTKNAVQCGALADCVMPGMLRANFSKANKLDSMEIIFDAMGFMQQLDGANGGEVIAQVIPGSLEMALMHSPHEARVITEAKPPYCVVHVNEPWTHLMKYTQLEVEGREFSTLIEGDGTDPRAETRPGKPIHKLEEVARGRSACSTNIHYDKFGNSFVDFMCSYPLTNSANEISHLLHVNQELPKMNAMV